MDKKTTIKNDVWSGRFSEPVDELVQRYTASVTFDKRMAAFDIQGSLAHAEMLCAQKILTEQDLSDIQRGLAQILEEINDGRFNWSIGLEDVHMNIERRLTDLIGSLCDLTSGSGDKGTPFVYIQGYFDNYTAE